MGEMVGNMQTQLKKTSSDLLLFSLKFISGSILGLTFALIMQTSMGYAEGDNLLAFMFVIIVTMAVFMRIAKGWGLTATLIFDLICVLVGMLLRLYIMVAG
jgi:hypothetical protein